MSDALLERLVAEIVALRERVAALETQESPRFGFGYPLGCIVTRSSTDQSIPNNSWTALSFDTSNRDVGGCWASGNPTRMVAPETGVYSVAGNAEFEANSGQRGIAIRVNGSIYYATSKTTVSSQRASLNVKADIELAHGDYAEIMVWHLTGESQNILKVEANSQHNCRGSLMRIA